MAKKKKEKDKASSAPRKRNDAYTMMLFVTLVAIGLGCTFMYLDFDEYGKEAPKAPPVPTVPALGATDAKI